MIPEIWQSEFIATREIAGLGLCVVQRFIYTCGLLTNVRFNGATYSYDARYCYPVASEARADLLTWDGAGDPPGEWVKEKVSDRARTGEP